MQQINMLVALHKEDGDKRRKGGGGRMTIRVRRCEEGMGEEGMTIRGVR